MNDLENEKKLKQQYWYYGVIPILFVYLIDIFISGKYYVLGFNDCLISQSCSELFFEEYYFWRNFFYLLSIVLLIYTIWNGYRVFVLSKNGIEKAHKIRVRIYVIVFPIIAIIASPILALTTEYYLVTNTMFNN